MLVLGVRGRGGIRVGMTFIEQPVPGGGYIRLLRAEVSIGLASRSFQSGERMWIWVLSPGNTSVVAQESGPEESVLLGSGCSSSEDECPLQRQVEYLLRDQDLGQGPFWRAVPRELRSCDPPAWTLC